MDKPLITVLMPVYNAENYIREAIESILHQTFTHFEFLIIDDGSTDSSVEIIKSYSDSRIRLIQNTSNLGISATLNKGIELASAELIARMDADDISYPDRLQNQIDCFQKDADCVLLSAAARVVSENGEVVRVDQFHPSYYYYNLTFICWIYHPSVMYKRSAVLGVGGYNEEYSEDFNLWWHLLRNYKIVHLPKVLIDYRLSAQSLSLVTKKQEYELAQHQQVVRNIQFYTGRTFELTFEESECYRFNFEPLLRLNSAKAIIKAINKLSYITDRILQKPNVNLDKNAVKEAFNFKKEYTLNFYLRNLSAVQSVWLRINLILGLNRHNLKWNC